MPESEQSYLDQCREQGICPACHKATIEKYGSGQQKDGVFCSLDCYGEWHKAALIRRHEERMKKERSDE